MNIITFSLDTNVVNPESSVARRLVSYADVAYTMDVIVPVTEYAHKEVVLSPYVRLVCVQKGNKVATFLRILREGFSLGRSHAGQPNTIVSSQDPFELGLIACIVAWRYSFPLHLQVHIDFFSTFFKSESLRNRLQAYIARHLLLRADAVRVVSKKIEAYVCSLGVPHDRVMTAPIGCDLAIAANVRVSQKFMSTYAQYSPKILCASRFVKQKNIPLSIAVFERVFKEIPGAGLILVGKGNERPYLEDIVRRSNLGEQVKFEDWTDDLFSYMKAADIFLLTSDYEGWGMSIIEACAVGTPVVMTDVGCAGEFLIDGENGCVAPVRDVDALAQRLLRLAHSYELCATIGARAKESVQSLPSKEAYVNTLRESWTRALETSRVS